MPSGVRVRVWVAVAALMLLAVLTAGCTSRGPVAGPGEQPADAAGQSGGKDLPPVAGNLAPGVVGIDVMTGEQVSLSALKGQVVMLNFWATWCAPCRVEMPAMQAFYEESGGQVRMLAVGADPREESEQLADFARELGLTFTILFDEGEAAKAYRSFGIPTSVFVDQHGVIRARHTGPLTLVQIRDLAAKTGEFGRR